MADTPGPKRATRAASRALSQAPTPAPQSRRRAGRSSFKAGTPLPATRNAESNSYGTAGKVDLSSQTATNMNNRDFFRAFARNRNAAVIRDSATSISNQDDVNDESEEEQDETEDDEEEQDEEEQDDSDEEPDRQQSPPARDSRAGSSNASSSVRLRAPPRQPSATSARTSPRRSAANRRGVSEDTDDQLSALPSHMNRLRNGYDTSPLVATSILQQRTSRAFSITDLNSGFSYEAPVRTSPRASPRLRSVAADTTTTATINPPPTDDELEDAGPSPFTVFLQSVPRWWRQTPLWMKLAPLIACLSILFLVMCGPTLYHAVPNSLGLGTLAYQAVCALRSFSSPVRGIVSTDIPWSRINVIEKNISQLGQHQDLFRKSLKQIEDVLPSALLVRKDPVTGRLEIPNDFWLAMRSMFTSDPLLHSTQDGPRTDASWDVFLERNKDRISETIKSDYVGAAENAIASSVSSGEILSRAAFMDLLERNSAERNDKLNQRFALLESQLRRGIQNSRQGSSYVRGSGSGQDMERMKELAITNLIHNQELTLKTVNYLSPALGATVDITMTSTTLEVHTPLLTRLHRYLTRNANFRANPEIAALEAWHEPTDCWCAAASDIKGLAQLGVTLAEPIEPHSVTIEHIPATGTTDQGSAPRDFEIWVHAPHVQAPSSMAAQAALVPECRTPPDQPPAPGYICLGGGTYELHPEDGNHIQNFGLYVRGGLGASVSKVVVRVSSNWGGNWTCLYRVRMHGLNQDEINAKDAERE